MGQRSLHFTAGDVAVVTGGGSGIGHATAVSLSQAGLHVAVWDLDDAAAARTVDEIAAAGGSGTAITCDVGNPAQVAAGWNATRQLGVVSHLVNNAGPTSAADIDFDVAVALCIGSMRRMTEHWLTAAPTGSSVVNVASIAGNMIATDSDWYTAAKAGIAGYTRYLAVKRADQCRANAVAPGIIDTPRVQASGFADTDIGRAMVARVPLQRLGRAADVAEVITFLLSDEASYVNGALVPIDGGVTSQQ